MSNKKNKGQVIIISGPSGSGKTTLHKKLLTCKHKLLVKTISATTRPKRQGEKHGRDYFFLSEKMFLYKKRRGHFLETQKVFDNYYGTPKKNVQDLLKNGKTVLLCIDVKGAKVVCHKIPEARTIFIKTPSLEVLRKRLEKRGSEGSETLKLRLAIARKELKESRNYQHVIVNDNLKNAYEELERIVFLDYDCKSD